MKRRAVKEVIDTTPPAWAIAKVVLTVIATLLCVYLAWFLPMMLPFVVSEHTSFLMVTISYNATAYVVYLLVGGGMIVASVKLGFERQLYHWIVLIGGILVMVLGMLYVFMEKVEITQQGCYSRTWFGLSQTTLKFADLKEFRHIQEPTAAWSRKGPRPSQMIYVTKHDNAGTFLASYYPTVFYNAAYGQLLLAWALYGKGLAFPVMPKP